MRVMGKSKRVCACVVAGDALTVRMARQLDETVAPRRLSGIAVLVAAEAEEARRLPL